jgi:trypsin
MKDLKRFAYLLVLAMFLAACSSTPIHSDTLDGQIVNGKESVPFSRPYQVRLSMGCGGTLISKEWILTARHCPRGEDLTNITARVGVHRLSSSQGETIRVSRVVMHPERDGWETDIALLKLERPVTDPNAIPALLPTAEVMRNAAAVGKLLTVSGWGQLAFNRPSPDALREADLEVVDCGDDTKGIICGGYTQQRSACFGDSGGPYAARYNNKFYVIGAVSGAHGPGVGGNPCSGATGFAKVSDFLGWIERVSGVTPGNSTVYRGTLSQSGAASLQPSSTGFTYNGGNLGGKLTGPSSSNFNLYLQKKNGNTWQTVTRSTNPNSSETILYTASRGTYRWRVSSVSGGGPFTLTETK